ncbi:MAG: EAL domain-containing protein [Alteromonadaceae bacterium]|nr:EAL domain-containing protein [Alteromonadaceae bacterium]
MMPSRHIIFQSIGIKTVVSVIATTGLFVVAIFMLILTLSEHKLVTQQTLSTRLQSVSDNLAQDLFPELVKTQKDSVEILEKLLRLSAYEGVRFAYVTDDNDKVLSQFRGIRFDDSITLDQQINRVMPINSEIEIRNTTLISKKFIGEPEEPVGYIVIVEDIDNQIKNSNERLLLGVTPLLLICLFIVVSAVLFGINLFSRPIRLLSKFALEIAQSRNFKQQVQPKGTKEVWDLAKNFNYLLEQITLKLEENKRQNRQLLEQHQEMEVLANYDSLTKLPNRQSVIRTLELELQNAKRKNTDFEVMIFDIDGFKSINDELGHEVGDLLLLEIAKAIKNQLEKKDLLARFGGDEFLIRLSHDNKSSLETIGLRLSRLLKEPLKVDSWQIDTSISAGIIKASDASYDLKSLISYADTAMHYSKGVGKGVITHFTEAMLLDVQRKNQIKSMLTKAIKKDDFSIVLQPRFNRAQKIYCFEVLCRWSSEELGFISPGEFIPIAEQTGKITELTFWVIKQAAAAWHKLKDVYGTEVKLSLNVSTKDLLHPHFFEIFQELIKDAKINPGALELEITETSYLNDTSKARSFCQNVRAFGCTVALDDFGTGYSSLSYLTQMEFDVLKIDRSFVNDIFISNNAELVIKTIIQLAKQLNLAVCAEGVETKEQFDFLIQQGTDEFQGYLLGKPAAVHHWLGVTTD